MTISDEKGVGKALAALMQWRRTLLRRLLALFVVVSLPVVVGGGVTLYRTGYPLLTAVLVVGYLSMLVGALARRLSYPWRVAFALEILPLLSVARLFLRGWDYNVSMMLLAFAILLTILWGQRAGWAALGTALVILGGFAGLVWARVESVPGVVGFVGEESAVLLAWGTYAVVGGAVIYSLGNLFPYLSLASELRDRLTLLQERVETLQQANASFQRRATYLEASVRVTRALATVFEVEPLLEQAVNLITDTFGFYHAGIFLVDETGEWGVLKAASSAGGRRMLARGHRLRRGAGSIVGWVMEHRRPRIAEDVDEDAMHLANPDLPATRSEMAVPLIVAGELIGVLDVQSTEEDAFDQDDIRVLQELAEQLAISIMNARRLGEESAQLEATSPFYRLARRLATTRTDREVYAAVMDVVRAFAPTRALIVRLQAVPLGDDAVPVMAVMAGGRVETAEDEGAMVGSLDLGHVRLRFLLSMCEAAKEPLMVEGVSELDEEELSNSLREVVRYLAEQLEARALALVPMPVVQGVWDLLVIAYDAPRPFSAGERQFYRVLADLAGVALERVQLVRDVQRRLAQERWMREFAEQLMRVPRLQRVVEQAAYALQQLAEADGVMIALEPMSAEQEAEA